MIYEVPGLNPRRLVALMHDAVQRCELNLRDMVVLTEAATGAYIVTPVLAAMSGARKVFAFTRSSPYGSIEYVRERTQYLADIAGVANHIEIITEKSNEIVAEADIITNSGHLRPINGQMISQMKPAAVVPLMYEAWELRQKDLDLDSCEKYGIAVAGTNERHPPVNVFSFLGVMAIKLLLDAGITIRGNNILLLCDNPFVEFIKKGFESIGAYVDVSEAFYEATLMKPYDVVFVALQPKSTPVITAPEASYIAKYWPRSVVVQFWGDIDRISLKHVNLPIWPLQEPLPGHMGILPSDVGPEPIVRLQSGGLKVGELLSRARRAQLSVENSIAALERSGFGARIDTNSKERHYEAVRSGK